MIPGRLGSSLRFIDNNNNLFTHPPQGDTKTGSLSREALGFIAVRFSCDELINSIGLSGLHRTLPSPGPPRAGRPITPPRRPGLQSQRRHRRHISPDIVRVERLRPAPRSHRTARPPHARVAVAVVAAIRRRQLQAVRLPERPDHGPGTSGVAP